MFKQLRVKDGNTCVGKWKMYSKYEILVQESQKKTKTAKSK